MLFQTVAILTVLSGLTLSLIRRATVTKAGVAWNLVVVSSFLAVLFAFASRRYTFNEAVAAAPFFAVTLREIALLAFNPLRRHQEWCMMFQCVASALTAHSLHGTSRTKRHTKSVHHRKECE